MPTDTETPTDTEMLDWMIINQPPIYRDIISDEHFIGIYKAKGHKTPRDAIRAAMNGETE